MAKGIGNADHSDFMMECNRMEFSLLHLLEVMRDLGILDQQHITEVEEEAYNYVRRFAIAKFQRKAHEQQVAIQRARLY